LRVGIPLMDQLGNITLLLLLLMLLTTTTSTSTINDDCCHLGARAFDR
jgi:hypothetical protein